MVDEFMRQGTESLFEMLYRIGKLKTSKEVPSTWDDIANACNEQFGVHYGESFYRKKWKQLYNETNNMYVPMISNTEIDHDVRVMIQDLEKKKIQLRAENNANRKRLRNDALNDEILDELTNQIKAIVPEKKIDFNPTPCTDEAVYALLSDVHYGIEFNSRNGAYNPDVAKQRILGYADKIVSIGRNNECNTCYVSLLGDMISGMIHTSLRIENTQNVITQVMEISQIVAAFFAFLGDNFEYVIVNSVSGNHSRIEHNPKDAPRGERLDDLVIWYCKAALREYKNIKFEDNEFDPSIAVFDIFGKTYTAVHGDFDKDIKMSVHAIQELINRKIDYFVYGHMHIINTRFENVGYIGNGAVISGGDEYTARKRLFGPAMQIVMIVNKDGIESLYPVRLR